MAFKTIKLLKSTNKLFYNVNLNSKSIWLNSAYQIRNYATEDVKEKPAPENPTNNTINENEKKLQMEIQSLTENVENLKTKNDELLDKYKRSLADGENLRTRLSKQIEDAKLFGIQGFCKDLLEVADILGHATNSVPKDQIDKNEHLKSLFEGLVMTQSSLMNVFKRHGLEQINPVKEKFNPNMHEALFQIADSSVASNIVIEVSKVGYKLKDRCIRPALVGVSK